MRPPDVDKSNGIIIGYVVYYAEKSIDGVMHEEFNITIPRNDASEGYTTTLIKGLKAYKWYQIEVVAFTKAGKGHRSGMFQFIQTFEDGMSYNETCCF